MDFGTRPRVHAAVPERSCRWPGSVISQDIFPDFLAEARKRTAGLKNVSFVQGNAKETKLAPKSADLILVLDVYHHLDYPQQTLAELRRALKPGGRLAIVEYHKNDVAMNGRAKEHVRLGDTDAVAEIEANGFRLGVEERLRAAGAVDGHLSSPSSQAPCFIFAANLLRNFCTFGRTTNRQYGCDEFRL